MALCRNPAKNMQGPTKRVVTFSQSWGLKALAFTPPQAQASTGSRGEAQLKAAKKPPAAAGGGYRLTRIIFEREPSGGLSSPVRQPGLRDGVVPSACLQFFGSWLPETNRPSLIDPTKYLPVA